MVADTRQKDMIWPVCDDERKPLGDGQYQAAQTALLMDLRDHIKLIPDVLAELRKLNTLLHTPGINSEMWGPTWLATYLAAQQKAAEGRE